MTFSAALDVRPHKPALRTAAIVLATMFAIGAPILQALYPFGLSAAEFADDGNETLRAAGYAFSIWSLIYLGLTAYAVYQAWPTTQNTQLLDRVGWPSVIALAGCGLWILASAFDQKLASVAIIATSATTLSLALVRGAPLTQQRREGWLVVLPLALLVGWLTIATAINALTVLKAFGAITETNAAVAGGVGIAAVALLALVVLHRARLFAYGAPIAWGLAAVFVAERNHRPLIALAAAAAAAIVLAGSILWGVIQRRRSP